MKKILKLSLVSLCATGAVVATQAHEDSSAAISSDKQLVVTEPAGADNSSRADSSYTGVTGWQGTYQGGTSYGASMQGQRIYESAGAPIGGAHMVTGREQDCYADCILKQYQAGKGAARVTDEHYWNNVSPDRMYAQYPASGSMYQNYAYSSYSSQPMASAGYSSSSTTIHSPRPAEGWTGSQGLWYAPDGRIYNSQGALVSGRAGAVSEPAGAPSGGYGQSSAPQSGNYSSSQSSSANAQSSSSAQPSATQPGTSGEQSSTELKGSETQKGSAAQEAAGAQPSTSSSTESATQPGSSTESSTQSSPSSTSTSPDQSSASTQSSTSTSPSEQGMTDKVRSTLKTDTTLSPISSDVTVQDQNGKVALNGTVKSEAEKQQVVSKAEEVAGSGNVIDNLQVQSDSNNSNSSNPNQ